VCCRRKVIGWGLGRLLGMSSVSFSFVPPFPPSSPTLSKLTATSVAKSIVSTRYAPSSHPRHDMLASFQRHGLTQAEASGEALLQVVAGSDTSAGTLRAVLLGILTNPPAYLALQREIDSAIASNSISSPISDAEAKTLPYLQATIREALRIMPPASGAFFKQVPKGGDTIAGYFVPEGTQIGSSPLGIHRSRRIFGQDADLFRPERWIEAEGEQYAEMERTVDLVFHYGRFQCLGKGIALMEFNKVVVEVRCGFAELV
jgi:cytochrome P450